MSPAEHASINQATPMMSCECIEYHSAQLPKHNMACRLVSYLVAYMLEHMRRAFLLWRTHERPSTQSFIWRSAHCDACSGGISAG